MSRSNGLTWFGKPVEELSRDELIEALYHAKQEIDSAYAMHQQSIEFLSAIATRSKTGM